MLLNSTYFGDFMKKTLNVVAALIWQHNKFLICKRPSSKARAHLWEFVGGKVEKGETEQQALARECMEELALEVDVGSVFCKVSHEYDDVIVHLTLFNATATGNPQMLEHEDLRWILPVEVDDFEFCPADKEILEKIKKCFVK